MNKNLHNRYGVRSLPVVDLGPERKNEPTAHQQGYRDRRAGKTMKDCPWSGFDEYQLRQKWIAGWLMADTVLKNRNS